MVLACLATDNARIGDIVCIDGPSLRVQVVCERAVSLWRPDCAQRHEKKDQQK